MSWLKDQKNWLPQTSEVKRKPVKKKVDDSETYTIMEFAKIFKVSRQTVWKWLSLDEPEGAVIPPDCWIKLPHSGHIRIKAKAIVLLKDEGC